MATNIFVIIVIHAGLVITWRQENFVLGLMEHHCMPPPAVKGVMCWTTV